MSNVGKNFTTELVKWGFEGEVKFYPKSGRWRYRNSGILEKVDSEVPWYKVSAYSEYKKARSSVRPEKKLEGTLKSMCQMRVWIFVLHGLHFSGMTHLLLASIATSVHTIIRSSLLEGCRLGEVPGRHEVGHKAWGRGRLSIHSLPPPN